MDNFLFATGYTSIIFFISYLYWARGRQNGINETVAVFKRFEPEAMFRIKHKLEEQLNVSDVEQ
jgi:hypothetical protein